MYRHKETGELFNNHELLTFSINNDGPNFDPWTISSDVMEYLNVEYVHEESISRQLKRYEVISGAEIVFENGVWVRKLLTSFLEGEEKNNADKKAIENAKDIRDQLLKETDWSQLSDVTDEIKAKYRDYRQQLRDVTKISTFPYDFEWPTKP
jgi:hypothetical protein